MLFGLNGRATRNFLALLVVMHFILFVDRVNLAAAAKTIKEDLGLSNLALGVAFSAFNMSAPLFANIGHILSHSPAHGTTLSPRP